MKKITAILLALLLAWCGFLSYQVYYMRTKGFRIAGGDRTIIDATVTRFSSDLTKLIENCEPKVVAVAAYRNGRLTSYSSGIVYQASSTEVLIVTNYHVIENTNTYKVRFASGIQLDATLVGFDSLTDLVVLSVAVDFVVEPFKMGDSSLVKVGEYVIAIGSPLGFDFQGTTTFGIISGKDRVLPVDLNNDGIDDWDSIVIQTDAAINPGNSGGALVNMAGELIGITSMKVNHSNVEGMGFAIPVNEMVAIVEQIKEHGMVKRPLLGVSGLGISDMSSMEKNYYSIDLSLNSGIYVTAVAPNSAADKAGIMVGDIITKMDGVNLSDYKQFRIELYKKSINQDVSIEVLRDGEKKTFETTLASN